MSLVNLFSNRKSQKIKKDKSSTNVPKSITAMPSADSDIIAVVNDLINAVSKDRTIDVPQTDQADDKLCESSIASTTEVSDFVEMAESDLVMSDSGLLKSGSCRLLTEKQGNIKEKVTRSVSVTASEIESQARNIRRKFGSEGEIHSIIEKVIPPEQQKELNEAIEKYIEKLIKDSICKTLQSVDVEDKHDELINDNSSGKLKDLESEEEFIVEQRLGSNSITEFVELDNIENDENNENVCHKDSLDSDGKLSETENTDNEIDEIDQSSFGGYLADLDDTTSVDDLKSMDGDSLNNSLCNDIGKTVNLGVDVHDSLRRQSQNIKQNESTQNSILTEVSVNNDEIANVQNANEGDKLNQDNVMFENGEKGSSEEHKNELKEDQVNEKSNEVTLNTSPDKNVCEEQIQSIENTCQKDEKQSVHDPVQCPPLTENTDEQHQNLESGCEDLILMSTEEISSVPNEDQQIEEVKVNPIDVDEGLPEHKTSDDDERLKVNWKVGNLHIKLPHKTRGKAHLKAWKKRRVVIQPDEFVNDPRNPSLVISVYGSDSKKHEANFWYSLSSQKAVIFRSSSRTHRYAFTISEGSQAIIHLSAENETVTQEWMTAIRAVLWPPSPFMELEKMMSGREFDVSIIDNEFSYHAGLLGMYGYLTITPKKLILLHPQQGYVIQEWYLNTVDKLQFVPQPKTEDMHKVLCMTTCRDSSTGQGEILFFCSESVTLLQSLASSIHEVLSYHSKQEGGRYKKELEEMAEWLVAPPQDCVDVENDEHYKVPPRQVKSLLDIPNFIFNKSLSPVTSAIYPAPNSEILEPLDTKKNKQTTTSHDSGISSCASADDFLNCSIASFVIGGGPMTGKSSDSELSDAYTPPRTPEVKRKAECAVVKEEVSAAEE